MLLHYIVSGFKINTNVQYSISLHGTVSPSKRELLTTGTQLTRVYVGIQSITQWTVAQ